PPDVGADASLDVLVAREPRLALRRDGVDVVGAAQARDADLSFPCPFEQLEHEESRPLPARAIDGLVQRFKPLAGLVAVDIRQLTGQSVGDDAEPVARHALSPNACGVSPHSSEHPCPAARVGDRVTSRYCRISRRYASEE